MLKNTLLTEVSRTKLIESGKKDAEEKKNKERFRKAIQPNNLAKYH